MMRSDATKERASCGWSTTRRASAITRQLLDEVRSLQPIGSLRNETKGKAGALGDVEQRMTAVGKIQHPQCGQVLLRNTVAARRPIEAAVAELRFAVGREVQQDPVVLEQKAGFRARLERSLQTLGADEVQVIG